MSSTSTVNMSTNPFDLYPMPTFHPPIVVPQFRTSHPEPVIPSKPPAKATGAGVCPTCGKTFKQLGQHITKSHSKYVIRIVGENAYMSFNGEPEIKGEMATFDMNDGEMEWQWYPDGSEGTETIGVVRTKSSGKTKVWREGGIPRKKMYLHNVKINVY